MASPILLCMSSLPTQRRPLRTELQRKRYATLINQRVRSAAAAARGSGPGALAEIRIANELRKQVLAQKPGWPSEEERREDLATHLRVLEALDRVAPRRHRPAR
ncbi:hypothetical protein [Sorangium sp. So ce887]|uniref:hypothetical protein n=1 Tax=Sorangium sp. So ce887 TaxID=3133324 RepID=UPI003F5EE22A